MGNELFRVPNNAAGKKWWEQALQYKGEGFSFKRRGRGPRKNRSEYSDLSIDRAKEWAVYLSFSVNGNERNLTSLVNYYKWFHQERDAKVQLQESYDNLEKKHLALAGAAFDDLTEIESKWAKELQEYKKMAGETISRYAKERTDIETSYNRYKKHSLMRQRDLQSKYTKTLYVLYCTGVAWIFSLIALWRIAPC